MTILIALHIILVLLNAVLAVLCRKTGLGLLYMLITAIWLSLLIMDFAH